MEASARKSFQRQIFFNIFPRISLHCKVVPVQYWEYEYGLLKLCNKNSILKHREIHAPLNNHLIRKGQRMLKSSKKRLLIFCKANSHSILALACFYHTWIKDFSKSDWITCQRIYPEGIFVNKSMGLQCNSRHTVRVFVRGANIGLQSAHVVCPTMPCQTSMIKAHRQQH